MSYLSHLECSACGDTHSADQLQTVCPECQSPLLARYDLKSAARLASKHGFARRTSGIWRWNEFLPVYDQQNFISLGEGDSPILRCTRLGKELGFSNLFIKDESLNPTGTFKARGLAVATAKARELGVKKLSIPTAGNAGGALAVYAARAGLEARVAMPSDSRQANIQECKIAGAKLILVDGLIGDAAAYLKNNPDGEGWFDISTFKEPYRAEGKKIMGYELAEAFNWKLPDVIIYPTGGGTGLVGMWKAFSELQELGWLEGDQMPRMVVVQSSGCAPIVKAFLEGMDRAEFWEDAKTLATGLCVPSCFADRMVLNTLAESNGTAVAVTDEEIQNAQQRIGGLEGVFAAPEGAATLAGLERLIETDWVQPAETIILFNTGTGLKYLGENGTVTS